MSQENVELVRSFYADSASGRLVMGILDPQIEWYSRADLPDSGVHHGRAGVAALLGAWFNSFGDFHADFDDFIDLGDYVVVPMVLRGRVRGSSKAVAMPETHVWKMHKGLAVEVREYHDKDEALKAAGLSE